MKNALHIYGQDAWHDHALLIGSREALEALSALIDRALAADLPQEDDPFFTADGEGYAVAVAVVPADEIADYPLPYLDEIARDDDTGRWSHLTALLRETQRP
jgi:hypothetical protein